jgi:hypothetical protein
MHCFSIDKQQQQLYWGSRAGSSSSAFLAHLSMMLLVRLLFCQSLDFSSLIALYVGTSKLLLLLLLPLLLLEGPALANSSRSKLLLLLLLGEVESVPAAGCCRYSTVMVPWLSQLQSQPPAAAAAAAVSALW